MPANEKMNNKQKTIKTILGRAFSILGGLLAVLLLFAYGTVWIVVNGPSPTARRLFVLSVKETSAGGFLADIYLNEEEIGEILSAGSPDETEEKQDFSLIQLPIEPEETVFSEPAWDEPLETEEISAETAAANSDTDAAEPETTPPSPADSGIEVLDISGGTYNGKLMIIKDPTRVFVGVLDKYGYEEYGSTVFDLIQKYDATAGTNAGGFYDPGGGGTGGVPDGIVIYDYQLLWGTLEGQYSIAGLDGNGILHVGWMSGQEAMNAGIKYAASFGPALVINGNYTGGANGLGGGLNPRTAIGQRADGAILLLVINGRSIESLGASFDDLAEIMLTHGAVNATNLDGGSSSIMFMEGEALTSSAYIFGERLVATAILVK